MPHLLAVHSTKTVLTPLPRGYMPLPTQDKVQRHDLFEMNADTDIDTLCS